MSMNIHIEAVREITVNRTGKIETQTKLFDGWQTPTMVSYAIIESADPIRAYKDWVLSISRDEEVKVYAEDDIFGDGDPIGVEILNNGRSHIEEFDAWMNSAKEEGYDIKVEVW